MRRKRYNRPPPGGVGNNQAAGQGGLLEGFLGSATGGVVGGAQDTNVGTEQQPQGGVITAPAGGMPFTDQRNWWQRNMPARIGGQENTAAELNNAFAYQTAIDRSRIPTQFALAKLHENLQNQSALARFNAENEFKKREAGDVNPLYNNPALANITEPGQVPFGYNIDPQRAIYDRNLPFVGDTLGGKEGNVKFQEGAIKAQQAIDEAKARALLGAQEGFLRTTGQAPEGGTVTPTAGQLEFGRQLGEAGLGHTRAQTKALTRPNFTPVSTGEGTGIMMKEDEGRISPVLEYGRTSPFLPNGKQNPAGGQPYVKGMTIGHIPPPSPDANVASRNQQQFVVTHGQQGGPPQTVTTVEAPTTQAPVQSYPRVLGPDEGLQITPNYGGMGVDIFGNYGGGEGIDAYRDLRRRLRLRY